MTLITCSVFPPTIFTIVRLLFLVRRFLLTDGSSNMLQAIVHSFLKDAIYNSVNMPHISTLSLWEHSAFLQHWRSRETVCFTRASFTFLQTWTSNASLLKLAFKFLILSVNLHIVLSVFLHLEKEINNMRLGQRFETFFCVNTSHNFIQQ